MKRIFFLLFLPFQLFSQQTSLNNSLLPAIQSFASTSAVTGREEEAANYINALFEKGICKKDKLGNLVITIGSGSPKQLFAAPLDEPGYVISQIQDDGYLRIAPVGFGYQGNLYHQFLEGNEIKINGEKKIFYGVAAVPSSHYEPLRAVTERSRNPYQWQESFIDVGESSAKAIAAKGIQLLDPVTLNKKPAIIADQFIAAPSAASKSAVIALAAVAKTLLAQKITGTVVVAFTTLELINGKGIEAVVNQYGPFDQVIRFNRFLQGPVNNPKEILVDKMLPGNVTLQKITKPVIALRNLSLGNASIYNIGLPSTYTATPVEMVSINSINELAQTWLRTINNTNWMIENIKPIPVNLKAETYNGFQKEESIVSQLVSKYGVSTVEKPVREHILSQLPKWAKPIVDEKGNISITFGKGKQHIAFVGHMDEVGFMVDSIRNDGTLVLKILGGLFDWVWEAHAALVHTAEKDINAVFEPRSNYLVATKRSNSPAPVTANAGFHSREEALAAGVTIGTTSVTMPKRMIRLSDSKATARGFDDRAGCAALLLALNNINPDQLPFTVTFIWSVEEETGLTGATFAAKSLKNIDRVYPIDTYVSSDAAGESRQFGYCPLGNGAVIRVLESVNFIGRDNVTYVQNLATKNNIKIQFGMTVGGTDGQGFLSYGIPSVPLSWPGRYSHSPIEIMDFHDLQSLVQLITAIMKDVAKAY
ncbi:MAG: M20/M25/M40 family metallo-hydrolase [Sediminibacterium sp.]